MSLWAQQPPGMASSNLQMAAESCSAVIATSPGHWEMLVQSPAEVRLSLKMPSLHRSTRNGHTTTLTHQIHIPQNPETTQRSYLRLGRCSKSASWIPWCTMQLSTAASGDKPGSCCSRCVWGRCGRRGLRESSACSANPVGNAVVHWGPHCQNMPKRDANIVDQLGRKLRNSD